MDLNFVSTEPCGRIRTHVIHQPVAREYCVVTSSSGEPDMQVEETVIGIDKRNRCADILTKALPKEDFRFKKFRNILMNITD